MGSNMGRDLSGFVRIVRRLRSEDDGFTIVEVLTASFILLVALLSTAYTATIGFTYSARARQKQEATAVMNQVLEQAEAISDTALLEGMLTSDLCTNDTSTITGTAFISGCGTSSPTYGGESIVHSSTAGTSFLNPHVETTTQGTVDFTRYAFLTYTGGDTSGDEVRLTVVVEWGDGQTVTTDKVLETTTGCPVDTLHPEGGPCGSLIDAAASIPAGQIAIQPNGSVAPLASNSTEAAQNQMILSLPELSADVLSEQAAQVSGEAQSSGWSLDYVTGTGANAVLSTLNCGILGSPSSASDVEVTDVAYSSIPASAPTDDEYRCETTSGGGVTSSSPTTMTYGGSGYDATSGSRVIVTKGSSVSASDLPTTARSISTTSAGEVVGATTYTCNAETNLSPCGYGGLRINSPLYANLQDAGGSINAGNGSCTVVQAQTQTTGSSVFISQQTTGDGFVRTTITRTFPNVTLGCTPSNMTTLPWGSFDSTSVRTDPVTGSLKGYLLRLEGYSESVTLEAGPNGATGTPTASRTGSIRYWNSSTGTYPTPTSIGTGATTITVPAFNTGCMAQTPSGRARVMYSGPDSTGGAPSNPLSTLYPITWTIAAPTVSKTPSSGAPVEESVSFPDPLGNTTIYGYVYAATGGGGSCGTSADSAFKLVADLGTATASASYA